MLDGSLDAGAIRRGDQVERRSLICRTIGEGGNPLPELMAELASEDGTGWAVDEIIRAMTRQDLGYAQRLALSFAKLRNGPLDRKTKNVRRAAQPPLSLGKLEHDLLQFRHLNALGKAGTKYDRLIGEFESAVDRFRNLAPETRIPVDGGWGELLFQAYGRISHLAKAPRLAAALSSDWAREETERTYLQAGPGVVVIDNFLTRKALERLQRFCVQSTIWHGNRYPHGRLGAFFTNGFSCPLLAQISEELRHQLPMIIGERHPLRQLWAFKYPPRLPGDSTIHADFAAVNVNFWISPNSANRDEQGGGLVIFEADAPADWDFRSYNERIDLIRDFLTRHQVPRIDIPYRENRAVVFNSDLFHATAALDFRNDYETRRVNITMLYGNRSSDQHHPEFSSRTLANFRSSSQRSLWRSARSRSCRH